MDRIDRQHFWFGSDLIGLDRIGLAKERDGSTRRRLGVAARDGYLPGPRGRAGICLLPICGNRIHHHHRSRAELDWTGLDWTGGPRPSYLALIHFARGARCPTATAATTSGAEESVPDHDRPLIFPPEKIRDWPGFECPLPGSLALDDEALIVNERHCRLGPYLPDLNWTALSGGGTD